MSAQQFITKGMYMTRYTVIDLCGVGWCLGTGNAAFSQAIGFDEEGKLEQAIQQYTAGIILYLDGNLVI